MIWLFDNGHGGMVGARYLTKGKRSPEVVPGLGVYEGEFNRDIVKRVVGTLQSIGTDAVDLVPEAKNVKLRERVARANEERKPCRLISIHANADGRDGEWTKAHGLVVFHYPGSKKGKALAGVTRTALMSATKINGDRGIRKARWDMLRKTKMPAILVEHGFMTHRGDARKLASDKFRQQITDAYVEMILQIEG